MEQLAGFKDISSCLGISISAVKNWAKRPEWPAPVAPSKDGLGRPESMWQIDQLPVTLAIKNKRIAIREPVQAVYYRRLQAMPGLAAPVIGTAMVTVTAPDVALIVLEPRRMMAVPVGRQREQTKIKEWQLAYRDGAAILCQSVLDLAATMHIPAKQACERLATMIEAGEMAAHIQTADQCTYLRPRQQSTPAQQINGRFRRLERMIGLWRRGEMEGNPVKYLLPGTKEEKGFDPVHVAAFLRFFCRPGQPPVMSVWKAMCPWLQAQGFKPPSYSTVTRIECSLPVTVKYRGRMTGAAFRSLKPYIERDVSMFKANDIWVGDGHSFKARIQSPIHGQAFKPEVTFIIDWVSRKIVGWSVALSESTIAVSDAFRHAQRSTKARPLIYYSDNGSGQTGKSIDHPIYGTLARQGIAHETGIPGNPQGRGIIERMWASTLIPLARSYPTALTATADRETVRVVSIAIAKGDKSGETSKLLPSWPQFIADLEKCIHDYNAEHKHSSLGSNTPDSEYLAKLDPDSVIFAADASEIDALWMPEVERLPSRGNIKLFGNVYHRGDLVDVLGEEESVRVRYDVHDADTVWLWRHDGSYLGEAKWNAHRHAAFPIPMVEQKRLERAGGIKKRAEQEIQRAEDELMHTLGDASGERVGNLSLLNPQLPQQHQKVAVQVKEYLTVPYQEEKVHPINNTGVRPLFDTLPEKYRWLMQNKAAWTSGDAQFLNEFINDKNGYAVLSERFTSQGFGWEMEDAAQVARLLHTQEGSKTG